MRKLKNSNSFGVEFNSEHYLVVGVQADTIIHIELELKRIREETDRDEIPFEEIYKLLHDLADTIEA